MIVNILKIQRGNQVEVAGYDFVVERKTMRHILPAIRYLTDLIGNKKWRNRRVCQTDIFPASVWRPVAQIPNLPVDMGKFSGHTTFVFEGIAYFNGVFRIVCKIIFNNYVAHFNIRHRVNYMKGLLGRFIPIANIQFGDVIRFPKHIWNIALHWKPLISPITSSQGIKLKGLSAVLPFQQNGIFIVNGNKHDCAFTIRNWWRCVWDLLRQWPQANCLIAFKRGVKITTHAAEDRIFKEIISDIWLRSAFCPDGLIRDIVNWKDAFILQYKSRLKRRLWVEALT